MYHRIQTDTIQSDKQTISLDRCHPLKVFQQHLAKTGVKQSKVTTSDRLQYTNHYCDFRQWRNWHQIRLYSCTWHKTNII